MNIPRARRHKGEFARRDARDFRGVEIHFARRLPPTHFVNRNDALDEAIEPGALKELARGIRIAICQGDDAHAAIAQQLECGRDLLVGWEFIEA